MILHNEKKNRSLEVKKGLKTDERGKEQGLRALASLMPALHHPEHLDLPSVHSCY